VIHTKDGVARGKLGSLVYAERIRLGWSLRKAGAEWGISYPSLSRIERGLTPSGQTLAILVGVLGLSSDQVAYLFS
jgi:transcriptional regulator with XRE-family HTH domain